MLSTRLFTILTFVFSCAPAFAGSGTKIPLDLTLTFAGIFSLVIFVIAYAFVIAEEAILLPKSFPVLIAAGLIWIAIAIAYRGSDNYDLIQPAIQHNLMEYAELMLFLIVAMTYINAMEERHLFDWLRDKITDFNLGLRSLFWLTGIMSFCIAPIADNLTTALLMCSVVMAVGVGNPVFIGAACVNIVVAANAGGAFSPFGDITTLMVWQKNHLGFFEFFQLFLPSVVNFVIPATIISFTIPNDKPKKSDVATELKYGAGMIVLLFLLTIASAVIFHSAFHIPPVAGMMFGLGYLSLYSYYLSRKISVEEARERTKADATDDWEAVARISEVAPFNVFSQISRSHWDTLIFFYGVVLCVGGLGFIGYLELVSATMYDDYGPTTANIAVGFLSALVDNIPVMFAVLTMNPDMSSYQWLLVTLTAGVGGSMLSIGSAAGVALMGQAHGYYTFFGHLKWSWAILLGYIASILTHYWINGAPV